jgi:hypothetical protein
MSLYKCRHLQLYKKFYTFFNKGDKFLFRMSKSVRENQKWTKKMSNFQKCQDFMEKGSKISLSEHYDATHKKNNY